MKLNRTGSNWNELERNKINENWDIIEGNVKRIEKTVSDLVLESGGNSNLEVVQARGGMPVLNDRLNSIQGDTDATATLVNGLQISKVDKSYFNSEMTDIRKSIDEIIVTPSEGISEQEIIDARMGKDSLGTNIRGISNNQRTSLSNKIFNGNFLENSLEGYNFFFGTGQLSRYVPGYSRDDLLILTSSGSGHDFFGATAVFKLADSIPETDVWYIKARARTSGDTVVRIRAGFRGSSGILDGAINDIEPNKWYDISFRFDPKTQNHSMSGEFRASLFFTYQKGTQSGKVAEVDNWLAINLTETFGAGSEPTKEQMDKLLSYFPDKYFGINDVGSLASANSNRITSVEKEVEDKLNDFESYIENSNRSLINNIVDNGDFSKTSGGKWRTQNSTWRIENNTMTLIGVGNNSMPAVTQNIGVPFKQGNKLYVRADLTPKNADFTRLALMAYASSGGDSIKYFYIDGAEEGVRKTHSNVFELAQVGTGDLTIQIRAQYSSANASLNKEVDINKVLVIDLTETFGKGNEPSVKQMDEVIGGLPNKWFDTSPRFDELQKSMMSYVFNKKDKGGVGLKRPLIAITFDDGFRSDIDLVYPEFKQRGITGTSYIWTDRTDNYAGAMNPDDLIKLKLNGWGIECHTRDHLRLAELSDQEIHEQFQAVNQDFERYGLPLPQHHALPFGSGGNVKRVQDIVMQYRKSCRNIHSNSSGIYNDWDTIDFSALNARSADITDANPHVVDLRKSDIDLTVEEKGILILIVHKVSLETNGQYEAKLEHLLSVVDYAIEKGMKFVTLDEMYERVKEYQNVVN